MIEGMSGVSVTIGYFTVSDPDGNQLSYYQEP